MKNSYEMPEVFELGKPEHLILGAKYSAIAVDALLGALFITLIWDIDETDE